MVERWSPPAERYFLKPCQRGEKASDRSDRYDGEMVVLGEEMEVLMSGPLVSAPDEPMLVMMDPLVLGVAVPRLGRI